MLSASSSTRCAAWSIADTTRRASRSSTERAPSRWNARPDASRIWRLSWAKPVRARARAAPAWGTPAGPRTVRRPTATPTRIAMRVGVAVGRRTVRGPAGVPHAGAARARARTGFAQLSLQIREASGLAFHRDGARSVEDRDARRVVSAILHAAQRVDDDAESIPVPDVPHDSAHGSPEYLSDNVHVVSASVKSLLSILTSRGPHRVLRGNLAIAGQPGVVYTPESGRNLPAVAFGHGW